MYRKRYLSALAAMMLTLTIAGCDNTGATGGGDWPTDSSSSSSESFSIDDIADTYPDVRTQSDEWGPYNVHDPSIIKADDGDYYAYSTDVMYGGTPPVGIQVRRSADLIEWKYLGTAFDGLPQMAADFITAHGGTPNQSVWAPYIEKHGSEYRLYYALASDVGRLSAIGLAVSSSPTGPWTERGLVVTSQADDTRQTNAIDPTVVTTPDGDQWFYYGSAWDGIYTLQLDPDTGLAKTAGDIGVRVAYRGFTQDSNGNWNVNGNLEAPEVIYNPTFKKYYLFQSYDWLSTMYNVRVGRADSPQGPFYDFNGVDMNEAVDHGPMIIAPYQFTDHGGWQGVAHNSTFSDGDGNWFIAHQGRPSVAPAYMVLHVRKLHWTEDGWPIASPERYAGVAQTTISADELAGTYDEIVLSRQLSEIVPGYEAEQTDPELNVAFTTTLDAAGTINGDVDNTWSYDPPWLELHWYGGEYVDKLYVERGRDWEHYIPSTILLTGMNAGGLAIWGKKLSD
ncbi:arabinan endo-1,5-alpha-L-arabinosidase [Solimonas marina]|uniref:Family 43 glycosylhydrolase n=1 Tax=Solimonas marina TaxID=2714601 RepID=A0A969WGE2_9GAMM|nr:arabinan endo-1,5-alpha-L-arabinosidase [Solimonas marina]NKF24210.1 family 43 glycosylhydrolase [Solimonas marina]